MLSVCPLGRMTSLLLLPVSPTSLHVPSDCPFCRRRGSIQCLLPGITHKLMLSLHNALHSIPHCKGLPRPQRCPSITSNRKQIPLICSPLCGGAVEQSLTSLERLLILISKETTGLPNASLQVWLWQGGRWQRIPILLLHLG